MKLQSDLIKGPLNLNWHDREPRKKVDVFPQPQRCWKKHCCWINNTYWAIGLQLSELDMLHQTVNWECCLNLPVYIAFLILEHTLCLVTKGVKLKKKNQESEMSFRHRLYGLTHRDGTQQSRCVLVICTEWLSLFWHLMMTLGHLP